MNDLYYLESMKEYYEYSLSKDDFEMAEYFLEKIFRECPTWLDDDCPSFDYYRE